MTLQVASEHRCTYCGHALTNAKLPRCPGCGRPLNKQIACSKCGAGDNANSRCDALTVAAIILTGIIFVIGLDVCTTYAAPNDGPGMLMVFPSSHTLAGILLFVIMLPLALITIVLAIIGSGCPRRRKGFNVMGAIVAVCVAVSLLFCFGVVPEFIPEGRSGSGGWVQVMVSSDASELASAAAGVCPRNSKSCELRFQVSGTEWPFLNVSRADGEPICAGFSWGRGYNETIQRLNDKGLGTDGLGRCFKMRNASKRTIRKLLEVTMPDSVGESDRIEVWTNWTCRTYQGC